MASFWNHDGREIAFSALTGSYNYNLNDETSDKDYKYFVLPTFRDLYYKEMYSDAKTSLKFDYSVHDVRKLADLWWKSNINFLEVLFSSEITVNEPVLSSEIRDLLAMRNEIAKMNIPYLYNACRGMHFEKMSRLNRASEGTEHLVERHGYNTKEALHAYRCLNLVERFADTDFEDFADAMRYDEDEREDILAIKYGAFTEEEFRIVARQTLTKFDEIKDRCMSVVPNENLKLEIDRLVFEIVRKHIDFTNKW